MGFLLLHGVSRYVSAVSARQRPLTECELTCPYGWKADVPATHDT